MKKTFKAISTVLATTSLITSGLAYADVFQPGSDPFATDNSSASQSNQATTNTPQPVSNNVMPQNSTNLPPAVVNSFNQNTAPIAKQSTTPVPAQAPSLQLTNPSYDFTKPLNGKMQPPSLIYSAPQATPGSGGASSQPTLGPGGTQPDNNQSIISALNALDSTVQSMDTDVKNGNLLSINQWNSDIQNQAAAGAMLLPNNLDFLWNQTNYAGLQQLNQSATNASSQLQKLLTCGSLTSSIGCSNHQLASNQMISNLLTPMTITNSNSAGASVYQPYQYSSRLTGSLMSSTTDVQQQQILSSAGYVLNQVANSNMADSQDQLDSPMAILQATATSPLSNTPDPTTNQTWFQQLSTASTPQLLRTLAIQLALNNYMMYQSLKASQNEQVLLSTQLVQEVKLEQAINNLQSTTAQGNQTLKMIQANLQNK